MQNQGKLELIIGPMFSGKSEELVRRVKRDMIANKKVIVFKPRIDTRYSDDFIVSHGGQKISALNVEDSAEILSYLRYNLEGVHTVAIDEAQFMDTYIADAVHTLIGEGIRVVCAGLSVNFRGELFNGQMGELIAMADELTKLTAVCVCCGSPAVYNQRITGGEPAPVGADLVVIGGKESYEARCHRCFVWGERN